jgi:hypothetical protein
VRLAPWFKVKCRKSSCPNFDQELQNRPMPPLPPASSPPLSGDFKPVGGLKIGYVNYRGEEKRFDADRTGLRQKGEHITARVAPTGKAISLSKKWIRNMADIQGLVAQTAESDALLKSLTPVERQILGYHRKRKSTSPRYEAILKKYPRLAGQ